MILELEKGNPYIYTNSFDHSADIDSINLLIGDSKITLIRCDLHNVYPLQGIPVAWTYLVNKLQFFPIPNDNYKIEIIFEEE